MEWLFWLLAIIVFVPVFYKGCYAVGMKEGIKQMREHEARLRGGREPFKQLFEVQQAIMVALSKPGMKVGVISRKDHMTEFVEEELKCKNILYKLEDNKFTFKHNGSTITVYKPEKIQTIFETKYFTADNESFDFVTSRIRKPWYKKIFRRQR